MIGLELARQALQLPFGDRSNFNNQWDIAEASASSLWF